MRLTIKKGLSLTFLFALFTTIHNYPMNSTSQTASICQLPQNTLHHIAFFLNDWKSINNLARTCKLLDRSVTADLKNITLNLEAQRKNHTAKDFLHDAHHLLTRITCRGGFNPIALNLSNNNLSSDDNNELEFFFNNCSHESIAPFIEELILWNNKLEILPSAITKLPHLQKLILLNNNLKDQIIPLVSTLHSLQHLALGNNSIKTIDPTIALLKNLTYLSLLKNDFDKSSLEPLTHLKKLQCLGLAQNNITLNDIVQTFGNWQGQSLNIRASDLEYDVADSSKLTIKLPDNRSVTIRPLVYG